MVLVKEKAFVYLKHKLDEYNERFGNKILCNKYFPYSTLNLIIY